MEIESGGDRPRFLATAVPGHIEGKLIDEVALDFNGIEYRVVFPVGKFTLHQVAERMLTEFRGLAERLK